MDLREADVEPGTEWTGWHVLEKDLWAPAPEGDAGAAYVPLNADQRERYAAQLLADTEDLNDSVQADDFTLSAHQLGNGAKSLLDEVATGKVTGEEEIWSHTDLWDFPANVDGAQVAFDALRPAVEAADPGLVATLDRRFAEGDALLDAQRVGEGFRLCTELGQDEVRALSAAVDALGEPLSRLTAAVASRATGARPRRRPPRSHPATSSASRTGPRTSRPRSGRRSTSTCGLRRPTAARTPPG